MSFDELYRQSQVNAALSNATVMEYPIELVERAIEDVLKRLRRMAR